MKPKAKKAGKAALVGLFFLLLAVQPEYKPLWLILLIVVGGAVLASSTGGRPRE